MSECGCGNREGTNKECERCRLIAEIETRKTNEHILRLVIAKVASLVHLLKTCEERHRLFTVADSREFIEASESIAAVFSTHPDTNQIDGDCGGV